MARLVRRPNQEHATILNNTPKKYENEQMRIIYRWNIDLRLKNATICQPHWSKIRRYRESQSVSWSLLYLCLTLSSMLTGAVAKLPGTQEHRYEDSRRKFQIRRGQESIQDITVKSSYSVECYSCMSSYFEREWNFLRHMYNSPRDFTDACNTATLDVRKLKMKNCTDMCVWLRVEDRIAGLKRSGYMRGCMSDVLNFNRTTTRFLTYRDTCTTVRLTDLFNRGHNYGFEPSEEAVICACHSKQCNSSPHLRTTCHAWCLILISVLLLLRNSLHMCLPFTKLIHFE